MKIAINAPFSDPIKGAVVIRINSWREHFERNGCTVDILTPYKHRTHNDAQKRIIRYKNEIDLIAVIIKNKYDVIIGTSPPMTHSFVSMIVSKLTGKMFILDVRDIWTNSLKQLKQKSTRSIKFNIYSLIEKLCYKFSDKIFIVESFMSDIIVKKTPIKRDKIILVPHGSNSELLKRVPKEADKIRKKLGIPRKAPVLVYCGGMGDEDLEMMLKNISTPILEKNDVHILFIIAIHKNIVSDNLLNGILEIVKSRKIKNFHLVKNIEYSNVCNYLSVGDIALQPLRDSLKEYTTQKTYDYMACELPIFTRASPQGNLKKLMDKYDIGYFASDWDEFNKNLVIALREKNKSRKKGITGRKIIKSKFSRTLSTKIALKEVQDQLKSF
ncbi:MAG: hypothetical protein ISS93_00445 [Candidatus Aenigmarchaeota archaeon]|nr:hypothetical protein [Candidatus Aenigmarchaeota archaeon]